MAPNTVRVRPYSDFLTALMHRRFSRSAAVLFLVCYVEAVLLGEFNSFFWSWFPFGRAGLRAGLIFLCGFSIFILRVSQMHVGIRTTASGYQTARQYTFRIETVQTALHYLFSAWLFSEIYIYSAPRGANINWITDAKNNERPRLNERPIYLTSYFMMLALVQTGAHLYYDADRIPTPARKQRPAKDAEGNDLPNSNPYVQIKDSLLLLGPNCIQRSLTMTIVGPVVYSLALRQTAWSWCLMFAKIFWSLPKSTAIPVTTPFHWRLLLRCLTGGFMLVMLWEIGNLAFSLYVAQEPLKLERPITYESRDPNGSLITGLKGKKLLTRTYAFWELVKISQEYQGRRKTIYEDIERTGGSSWSQISTLCLNSINEVNERIGSYVNPTVAAKQPENKIESNGLPRLTSGLKQEDGGIFGATPASRNFGESLSRETASLARIHGQTPSSPVAEAKELLNKARSAVLSPAQEEALTPAGLSSFLRPYALQVLESPVGTPFRQQYRRRLNAVVLGTPYGDVGLVADAIDSLTSLAICSLQEDPFGNVQHSISLIIRTFTRTIEGIELLKKKMPLHWTDVEKKRESPEVEILLTTLRSGLQELVDAFGQFQSDLKLSYSDMHAARTALQMPVEKEEPIRQKQTEKENQQPRQLPEMRQERPVARQRRSR